jgi:hypothetical protein
MRFLGRNIGLARLSIPLVIVGTLVTLLPVPAVQQSQLRTHVNWLTETSLAGRRSGQPGAARAAQYIFDQFKAAGFDVRMQEFSNNRRNVVARYGSVDRHVVIGAHYDGQSGLPSASDNAAGVAVMLELARDLKALRLPVSLVFIAFDDEEQGLNGSFFYADNPIFPLEQTSAAIIFDTMGRSFIDLKATTLFVLGSEYSSELSRIVEKRTRDGMLVAGVDLIGPRSDFAAFARRRIPFLFFSHATHKDYHGAGDRPELLNYPKLTQDSRLIGDIIVDTARLPGKPVYLDTPVYPAREVDTLVKIMNAVKVEKPDLPAAYRMVFDDLLVRVRTDRSRSTLNVAASAMLALATPDLSPFLLELVVAPAYEKAGKREIARAVAEEARKPRR